MENKEEVLKALQEFNENPNVNDPLPKVLENYTTRIAATGETLFQWHEIKNAFIHQMRCSIDSFIREETPSDKLLNLPNVENVSCEEMKQRILNKVNEFNGAPFTIQRLAELISNPQKHYKKPAKWLRGLEKNVNVVSTVDPFGTKVVNEAKLVNGLDSANGLDDSTFCSPERTLLPPPPVNSPVTSIPGWFNMTQVGNGDSGYSWPRGVSSTGGGHLDVDNNTDDNCTVMNGAKRLKTHHMPFTTSSSYISSSSLTTISEPNTTTTTSSLASTTITQQGGGDTETTEGSSPTENVQQKDNEKPSDTSSSEQDQKAFDSSSGDASRSASGVSASDTADSQESSSDSQSSSDPSDLSNSPDRRDSEGFDTPVTSDSDPNSSQPSAMEEDNATSSTESTESKDIAANKTDSDSKTDTEADSTDEKINESLDDQKEQQEEEVSSTKKEEVVTEETSTKQSGNKEENTPSESDTAKDKVQENDTMDTN